MSSLSVIGVSTQQANKLKNRNIESIEDLINYFPRKYNDYTKETGIQPEDQVSCLIVILRSMKAYPNAKVKVLKAFCEIPGQTDKLVITWFNQNYLQDKYSYQINKKFFLAGKVSYNEVFKQYEVSSPDIFDANISAAMRIFPVYKKIQGVSQEYLTGKIKDGIDIASATKEILPRSMVVEEGYYPLRDAYHNIHFPASTEQLQKAENRFIFNDLMYFALSNEWISRNSPVGSSFQIKTLSLMNKLLERFPYKLTEDQHNAVHQMIELIKEGKRTNALVQGDVGCGKSIVAYLMMAAFAGSGYQAALMAPTKVLARQHYEDLRALAEPLGCEVVYLGSELKAADKNAAMRKIANGEAKLIVGTHSVVGKSVQYKNLAITIADEEHKFGVTQRAALVEKASEGVHSITMSATPIPRSLAQVMYGNTVQLYTIQTMPAGRKPVITVISSGRQNLYKRLLLEVKRGHQIYVVCPMIDINEDMDGVESVEQVSSEYREALEPYGVHIETLTGKDNKEYTETVISNFKAGNIDILISTTVIEVGVNVPNATVMVITNAERFGLSSMHQLRGRVGRSDLQSYCVLEPHSETDDSILRLQAMCKTTNGFEIAEADLKIRGTGDLIGTKQSGENKYMKLMLAYPQLYKHTQELSKKLLDKDESCVLVERVKQEQSIEDTD